MALLCISLYSHNRPFDALPHPTHSALSLIFTIIIDAYLINNCSLPCLRLMCMCLLTLRILIYDAALYRMLFKRYCSLKRDISYFKI